jgi:hypothetical protein
MEQRSAAQGCILYARRFDGVPLCQFLQKPARARIARSPCSLSIWSGRGTTTCVPINVQAAKKPRNSLRCRKRRPFGSLLKRNRGVLLIPRLGRLTSLMRSWKMIANQTDRYAGLFPVRLYQVTTGLIKRPMLPTVCRNFASGSLVMEPFREL